jgi:flagellar motor switch protein FliG
MTNTLSPTLRKAAVLVRSLDVDSAAVLLAQLSPDEAVAVRRAIRELGEIDPLEQEELRHALRPAANIDEPGVEPCSDDLGVELAFSIAVDSEDSLAEAPRATASSRVAAQAEQPFAWLEGGDTPSLAAMLEREHLSTVAVVLSHLPADRASEVLSALPPGRRAAALERLADLGESDRASLEVIERELADWIAAQKAERQRRADRLRSIQAILRHSSPSTCESVLAEIATHDASLANEIGKVRSTVHVTLPTPPPRPIGGQAAALKSTERTPKPTPPLPPSQQPKPVTSDNHSAFPFERLTDLNDRQLAELFRQSSSDQVVLALAGASQRVTHHVESRLPKKVVRELRRRMHALASVRLSDFTAAQAEIASTAGRMFGGATK